MKQPIMKCAYSSEQLKEQTELLDYVDYLKADITLLKAKLAKARELYKKRVIEKINTNKKLLPDIKIELLDDALESFDADLNSITLESLKIENARASSKTQMELSKVLDDNEDR